MSTAPTVPARRNVSGPSASSRPRPPSRSSRRILSGSQQVELGGGAGILGTAISDEHAYALQAQSIARGASPASAASSVHSYNLYSSPAGSLFSTPSPTETGSAKGSIKSVTTPKAPTGTTHSGPVSNAGNNWGGSVSGSSRSIASTNTASSSSTNHSGGALRTPHSKQLDHASSRQTTSTSPTAAKSAAYRDVRTSNDSRNNTVRSIDKVRTDPPPPLPLMAQGPLPETPSSSASNSPDRPFSSAATRVKPRTKKSPPAPIHTGGTDADAERKSRDWARIDEFGSHHSPTQRNMPHTINHAGLPPPVPAKTLANQPHVEHRPVETSSTSTDYGSKRGRRSADMLRSLTPTGFGGGRKTPTPLDTQEHSPVQSTSLRPFGTTRAAPEPPKQPTLRTRRSADLLRRPSTELLNFGFRDSAAKEAAKEQKALQQRSLGVSTGEAVADGRKTPVLSLKKSSGALRALFRGKPKETQQAQDVPDMPAPRASISDLFRPTPTVSTPSTTASNLSSRSRTPSSPGSSLPNDRKTFPVPPHLQRSASDSGPPSPPRVGGKVTPRALAPSRELPAVPSPEGSPRSFHSYRQSPVNALLNATPITATPELPQPSVSPSGSDGARSTGSASTVRQVAEVSSSSRQQSSPQWSPSKESPADWSPTPSPGPEGNDWSPIKPSRSLHLLQLPDLDLSFDMGFDAINLSSPTTPRKPSPRSRRGSLDLSSPNTQSPTRSRSINTDRLQAPRTEAERALRAERRRSQSFDGPGSGQEDPWRAHAHDESWVTPQMMKLFSPSSSSAPLLSSAPELSTSASDFKSSTSSLGPALSVSDTDSASTHPSGRSSGHERTPSGSSSTHETSSPSPPRTPEDAHSAFMGLPPYGSETTKTTLDKAPQVLEPPIELGAPLVGLGAPFAPTPTPAAVPVQAPISAAPVAPLPAPPVLKKTRARIDNPAKPPKESLDPTEPAQLPPMKAPFKARESVRVLVHQSAPIIPDPSISTPAITQELENALDNFRYPMQGGGAERSIIIRNELLPFLAEVDKRTYDERDEKANRELRDVCFEWADALLFELRVEQPANERGACLEGLASILESSCLSAAALDVSRMHTDAFVQLTMRVMNFVMDKLGAKGVFHNTLLFSGRFLAFAFFRVPHVGAQLTGVLHPPRGALMRFTRPVLAGQTNIPAEARPTYPAHLQPLCFDNSNAYTRRLTTHVPVFETAAEKDAFHFQPGNWLRRWQSDDSELFPAFYRSYHRQLALYLAPVVEYYQAQGKPVPAYVLLRAPGYAHLATIFAKKCHSYILGSVNAVTTSSSAQQFDATESAGFRSSSKPAVLETANRRLVETLWTFTSSLVMIPCVDGRVIECEGTQLWGDMIDVWTKSLITKTSLYAPKGVFCLFDLLDGIVDPVVVGGTISPLDVPYLIGLVRTILNQAEHALTLVKVIAFVFTHWEILTAKPEDRRELCIDILLKRDLFERLLLFWSQSVRSYVLRLVVFRLGHLHTTEADGPSYNVELESVGLLQTRLDRIKKRYDELEPRPMSEVDDKEPPRTPTNPGFPRSRSTITMVTDSPQTVSRSEKLMGLGLVPEEKEVAAPKAASWWKRLGGKPGKDGKDGKLAPPKEGKQGKKSKKNSPTATPSPSLSDNSPVLASPLLPPANLHSPHSPHSPNQSSPLSRPAKLDNSPLLAPSPLPSSESSPVPSSNSSSESGPSTTPSAGPSPPRARKAPPPHITTPASAKPEHAGLANKAQFAFEFELPTASPRSDTFDPTPAPGSPRRNSQPPSAPTSPHMSHSFSKRSSLLPPPAANALDALGADTLAKLTRNAAIIDPGYPKRLHAYAIRMLAELEDAQKEYDEWWADGGIGKVDGAPPRLAVAWPFHEGED
ncbi:hypothetical protein Q8F55_007880 [Vanrija albida]|uniref:Uncharacterized protein n=1 Tax=Vanrija albida TaxID=181172 RepID=A0ABR3PUR6_9TREE